MGTTAPDAFPVGDHVAGKDVVVMGGKAEETNLPPIPGDHILEELSQSANVPVSQNIGSQDVGDHLSERTRIFGEKLGLRRRNVRVRS
jgi:hypothetical protein